MRVLQDHEHGPLARKPLHLCQENAKEPRLLLLRRPSWRRAAFIERQPHQLREQQRGVLPELASFADKPLQPLKLQ